MNRVIITWASLGTTKGDKPVQLLKVWEPELRRHIRLSLNLGNSVLHWDVERVHKVAANDHRRRGCVHCMNPSRRDHPKHGNNINMLVGGRSFFVRTLS